MIDKDYGPEPFVVNIEEATLANQNFRTVGWTGSQLQMTLMSIPVGGDIGLEIHTENDQFLRIEQGQALVQMGDDADNLNFEVPAEADFAIFVPKGKWHNIVNTGDVELKVYSIYAPAHHPHGAVHATQADAEAAEAHEHEG